MDVLSSITGCASLALEVFAFVKDEMQDRGTDAVTLSIRHDIAILRDFARIFDAAASSDTISEHDKLLLGEVCLALQPSLASIRSRLVRDRLAALTRSPVKRATDKVRDFLYRKAELQGISAELFQWTERYHIRLGLLPVALQAQLLAGAPDPSSDAPESLQSLRESFSRLTARSQRTTSEGLRKTEQQVVARPGPLSSRVFATMDDKTVVVEFKAHHVTLAGDVLSEFETEVATLAKLLAGADPLLCRILRCEGYFHQPGRSAFAFVYQVPRTVVASGDATGPVTLLDLISTTRPATGSSASSRSDLMPPKHALEQRFELARKITSAVMYVHVMQYVHKSIRSSNIIMFPKATPVVLGEADYTFPKYLGEPFLCGFETARHDQATSDQYGDAHWHLNIYRHPQRQGLHPQERLGVVLLELGLWRPLASSSLASLRGSSAEDVIRGKVRDYLRKLAAERLPAVMGTKYSDVVLFCLDIEGGGQISKRTVIDEVLKKIEDLAVGMQ